MTCYALSLRCVHCILVGCLLFDGIDARKKRVRTSWDTAAVAALDTDQCDIERVSASDFDGDRFEREFREQKPVVVEGLGQLEKWPAFERWQRAELLERIGDATVSIRDESSRDSLIQQKNGAGGTESTTLREFVQKSFDQSIVRVSAKSSLANIRTQNYQFDPEFLQADGISLTDDFHTPAAFNTLEDGESTPPFFFLGTRGSGVAFHRHGEVWNAVVHGRKRWFLYPKEWHSKLLGVDPDLAIDGLGWFKTFYRSVANNTKITPLECVTGPGDVLYLPRSWLHATVNVEDSVGMFVVYEPEQTDDEEEIAESEEMLQERVDEILALRLADPSLSKAERDRQLDQAIQMCDAAFDMPQSRHGTNLLKRHGLLVLKAGFLEERGDVGNALAALDAALALNPLNPAIYFTKSQILSRVNKHVEAGQVLSSLTDWLGEPCERCLAMGGVDAECDGETEEAMLFEGSVGSCMMVKKAELIVAKYIKKQEAARGLPPINARRPPISDEL